MRFMLALCAQSSVIPHGFPSCFLSSSEGKYNVMTKAQKRINIAQTNIRGKEKSVLHPFETSYPSTKGTALLNSPSLSVSLSSSSFFIHASLTLAHMTTYGDSLPVL